MAWTKFVQDLTPTQIHEDGDTTYLRWTVGTANETIRRIKSESDGGTGTITTIADAFGAWTNRASLTYTPIHLGGK